MAVWQTFFEFELALLRGGPLGKTSNLKKPPNSHCYLQWPVTHDKITQQNSLQKAGAH
jgi:hypothetical protein